MYGEDKICAIEFFEERRNKLKEQYWAKVEHRPPMDSPYRGSSDSESDYEYDNNDVEANPFNGVTITLLEDENAAIQVSRFPPRGPHGTKRSASEQQSPKPSLNRVRWGPDQSEVSPEVFSNFPEMHGDTAITASPSDQQPAHQMCSDGRNPTIIAQIRAQQYAEGSHEAHDQKRKSKSKAVPNKPGFVPDQHLEAPEQLLGFFKEVASGMVKQAPNRPQIPSKSMKGNTHGLMKARGYGGNSVGSDSKRSGKKRGEYGNQRDAKHWEGMEKLARQILDCLPAEAQEAMFPGVTCENLLEQLATFVTVDFSHASDLCNIDLQKSQQLLKVLHCDPHDQSSTVLLLWQDPNTPEEHKAFWYCAQDSDGRMGQVESIAGGYFCIFNGRKNLHGVIPCYKYNPNFPWYGVTLLRKATRCPPRDQQESEGAAITDASPSSEEGSDASEGDKTDGTKENPIVLSDSDDDVAISDPKTPPLRSAVKRERQDNEPGPPCNAGTTLLSVDTVEKRLREIKIGEQAPMSGNTTMLAAAAFLVFITAMCRASSI